MLRLAAAGGALAPRRRLLELHGSAAAALAAGPPAWRQAGLDDSQQDALRTSGADARSLDWLAHPEHHLIGWDDADYPPLLRRIARAPLALFVAGDPALLWHPAVAVVGSRAPSAGGRSNAAAFAGALATSGLAVTSGMALGVDAAAHQAALEAGGITVAVLGCGIDHPYPRANAGLYTRIAAAGAVVSEHPPGTPPRRAFFPTRNRIIAGLSLGTLVIEAALRSGALITARLAAEAGREVFAIPGSIHNPTARGCHRLIRDGAALVEQSAEVINALAPMAAELGSALRQRLDAPTSGPAPTPDGTNTADPDYKKLWHALGHDPTDMDQLVLRTGLTTAQLSSMLLLMELEGRVVTAHGRYSRTT